MMRATDIDVGGTAGCATAACFGSDDDDLLLNLTGDDDDDGWRLEATCGRRAHQLGSMVATWVLRGRCGATCTCIILIQVQEDDDVDSSPNVKIPQALDLPGQCPQPDMCGPKQLS